MCSIVFKVQKKEKQNPPIYVWMEGRFVNQGKKKTKGKDTQKEGKDINEERHRNKDEGRVRVRVKG